MNLAITPGSGLGYLSGFAPAIGVGGQFENPDSRSSKTINCLIQIVRITISLYCSVGAGKVQGADQENEFSIGTCHDRTE
jgi:hypothetical protein